MQIAYEKRTLKNGLDVIVHEDHQLPMVAVNVWYHVGSKNEQPGRTGFAHLFEHLMFEGSEHHDHGYFPPLQRAGALLNGSTNADRTNYWEVVPSNTLELALWMESDRMGFLLPALTVYVAFTAYPVLRTIFNSFHKVQPNKADEFLGAANYAERQPDRVDDTVRKNFERAIVPGWVKCGAWVRRHV